MIERDLFHKKAIWVGRFQPPTVGHVVALFVILSRYRECVIGVSYYTKKPDTLAHKWGTYVDSAEPIQKDGNRNPFSTDEVVRMWKAVLEEFDVSDRISLVVMPRVAYQHDFNETYPVDAFDFVDIECDETDPQSDLDRQKAFQMNLERPITMLRSPFKMHSSRVRRMIVDGDAEWVKFVPRSASALLTSEMWVERVRRIS